jgi:hypothetical protein
MRRASLSGLAICGFCSVLIVIVVFAVFRNHRLHNRAISTAIVSSSGQRLNDFFEGTKPDPRYSLGRIQAVRRAVPVCGKKNSSSLRSLFEITTVYAACPPSNCNGEGWIEFQDECNTGGSCSGMYTNTEPDPMSPDGFLDPGNHCGRIPQCGCITVTC